MTSLLKRGLVHVEKAVRLGHNDPQVLTFVALGLREYSEAQRALSYGLRALKISPGAFAANAARGQCAAPAPAMG